MTFIDYILKSKCIIGIVCTFCLLFQVTESKAQGFSESEVSYVSASTPGLFNGRSKFYICSDDLLKLGFCFPLPGCDLISDWHRDNTDHSGVDIKTFANDTVRSAFDGVVRLSREYGGYGNVIVVRHPFGLETVYSHNSKNLVESGDTVRAGQPISLEGRTGRATTEHVHFETRINGVAINPHWLFDIEHHTLQSVCLEVKKTGDGSSVEIKSKK